MKREMVKLVSIVALLLGFPQPLSAEEGGDPVAGKLHETRVAASEDPLVAECGYKLWIPADAKSVRVIFAINQRGLGRYLFEHDAAWRAMAARNRAATMLCEFEAPSVRDNGYGQSMLAACGQFAKELSRPELTHAPLVLWGHSWGGRVAQDFASFAPSRVLAFHIALRAFPSSEEFMKEETAAAKIPALYLMGEEDKKPADIFEHFLRARRGESPRAWIWLPGQAHLPRSIVLETDRPTRKDWRAWSARDVVIPWTEAMIQLRLPPEDAPRDAPVKLRDIRLERGWLCDLKTGKYSPYDEYRGNKAEASWLPSEKVAAAWARYSFPPRE
jgi:pimeloyl-ACP methyl ester carboxylesterase